MHLRIRKSGSGRFRGRIYAIIDFPPGKEELCSDFMLKVNDMEVEKVFSKDECSGGLTSTKLLASWAVAREKGEAKEKQQLESQSQDQVEDSKTGELEQEPETYKQQLKL